MWEDSVSKNLDVDQQVHCNLHNTLLGRPSVRVEPMALVNIRIGPACEPIKLIGNPVCGVQVVVFTSNFCSAFRATTAFHRTSALLGVVLVDI